MKISEFIDPKGIKLQVACADQNEAIDQLISLHSSVGNLNDEAGFKEAILAREAKGSTAIGNGIAVPHGKSSAVSKAGVTAITCPAGVDYKALDGNPTNLLFMIAAPEGAADTHLEVLSKLMTILMDAAFCKSLVQAKTVEEFIGLIDKKEEERYAGTPAEKAATGNKKIVAVTACPTGIAHTFMAAEALEQKAKELGIAFRVEKDGSAGAKDPLTSSEIAEADAVIVACDKNIDMSVFDGKKVVLASTKDAIHTPEKLFEKAETAAVYHHTGAVTKRSDDSNETLGRQLYKHLMNGVSHMLPFVIGGGILIAIAFLLDDYSIDPSNFGTNTPVAAWFKTIGGAAFGFMLPILAGFIAQSIADRPGLAVGFVGGALAASGATFANPGGAIPSAFLGALVAGFAAGYFMKWLEKVCDKLPQSLEGIKPVLIYPLCGITVIGIVMCAINPIVGALNAWISGVLTGMGTTSLIPLGIILGAMMATDMGGPLNKAAYVFGTAALAEQNEVGWMIMAAVMVGGMVPPIAIALATLIFPKKFTVAERKAGPVNFIMGFCFITEGAIPYAAADPLHVIPSLMVGSGVAGALSMAFKCTLMAPHGGIFVFPVVGNAVLYLVALAIGSAVSCLLLGLLKKTVED
ncbi:PTS system D-fructose-specific IIA component (F1P-forming), Frc family (TC 4.A.2.1.4)/PTS system D-fructose-specific IIB component (F1P-forming), Frc family (TC 4.A.2.1.4)/PTS system D-fructose-specific IIC component (F1P-forming), Frc family (TC 4.A.2.1.4) [Butyrivibrio fibrisolvens 16/4]|nr:PTS system D-fructose-specific IIA component (F1P-forming), Frc family (TC 4.A.2.1.4)/PTS system D-fructose-specific IIB component (F1P-forming), Frc family (TC 4.A.2.1.4)/PTS system D-fructose-specific IIC component (F1P-forming), Frc family (TC 4.A.2.1.4) [Butyrivibrio fibrisolvens 16/4]